MLSAGQTGTSRVEEDVRQSLRSVALHRQPEVRSAHASAWTTRTMKTRQGYFVDDDTMWMRFGEFKTDGWIFSIELLVIAQQFAKLRN